MYICTYMYMYMYMHTMYVQVANLVLSTSDLTVRFFNNGGNQPVQALSVH